MNNTNKLFYWLTLFVTILLGMLTLEGASYAATVTPPLKLMQPSSYMDNGVYSAEKASPETPQEPYINRKGTVEIDTETLKQALIITDKKRSSQPNSIPQQLLLTFFPEKSYSITVKKASYSRNSILNVHGIVEQHSIATFTMTVGPESYIVSLHDLNSNVLYSILGNMKSGFGEVTEVDLAKIPAVDDEQPVATP